MCRILNFRARMVSVIEEERQPLFVAGARVVDRLGILQGEGTVVSVQPEHLVLPGGLSESEEAVEKEAFVCCVRENATGREISFDEDRLLFCCLFLLPRVFYDAVLPNYRHFYFPRIL